MLNDNVYQTWTNLVLSFEFLNQMFGPYNFTAAGQRPMLRIIIIDF